MDLSRKLDSIGKSKFVKYYFFFKNESSNACISAFTENYTVTSKCSRTSHAKSIFRDGLQKDALLIIINSKRVDDETIARASDILKLEESE